jgi:hypothetical protein
MNHEYSFKSGFNGVIVLNLDITKLFLTCLRILQRLLNPMRQRFIGTLSY